MKKLLILLLALTMSLALFACDKKETPASDAKETPASDAKDDDLTYILGKGKIVIGITEYEPMNYYDDTGKLVGFDTEFAEALCAKLGVTPEFKVIDWAAKEIELKAQNIDCIWNGLTVNDERRENMAFTSSYLRNEQVVVIRASDADKYTALESLQDASIVAEEESAGAAAVKSSLPDANFTPVVSQAMALVEVKAGTADVAVIDLTMATAMTGEGTDYSDLMLVSGIKMPPEEYAIGLRLGSPAVEKFNELIAGLVADGTLASLAEKYGVSDLLIK